MAGRTAREALKAFIEPLQQSLSCITDSVITYRSFSNKDYPNKEPHVITVNNGDPVDLLCDIGLSLSLRLFYRIVEEDSERGPWKSSVAGYYYSLDDDRHSEIIAYHWHPDIGEITFPHLHISKGSGATRQELFRAHLPTGRIALEDMIRCTIVDFKARPLRDDWMAILAENRSKFIQWRTWA